MGNGDRERGLGQKTGDRLGKMLTAEVMLTGERHKQKEPRNQHQIPGPGPVIGDRDGENKLWIRTKAW